MINKNNNVIASVSKAISIFFNRFFDLVFQSNCKVCNHKLDDDRKLCICSSCWSKIELIKEPYCIECGIPLCSSGIDNVCGECIKDKNYFSIARSIGIYDGTLRKAIHLFKYKNKTLLSNYFSGLIKEQFDENPDYMNNLFNNVDYVLPVPLHKKKLKQREYNQSLILSDIVSKIIEVDVLRNCLVRTKTTVPQSDLPRKERFKNVKDVFAVVNPSCINDKVLLLVDDIFTTGATVNECAKVLLKADAREVRVFTLSRTLF